MAGVKDKNHINFGDRYSDYLDEYIKEQLGPKSLIANLVHHITYTELRKLLREFPEWCKQKGIKL